MVKVDTVPTSQPFQKTQRQGQRAKGGMNKGCRYKNGGDILVGAIMSCVESVPFPPFQALTRWVPRKSRTCPPPHSPTPRH